MTNTSQSIEDDSDVDKSSTSEVAPQHQQPRGRGRKGRPKGKKSRTNISAPYRFSSYITEKPDRPIFAIQFNYYIQDRNIFATASGPLISIYECDDDDGIKLIRAYTEPDKDEFFNAIAWSYETIGNSSGPILACGGAKGILRTMHCNDTPPASYKSYIGHTGAINDLKFHPIHPHLLLTGSKDYSIRLWNIRTTTCVALFSGIAGHRDEVLTIDIAPNGKRLISGGIDHNIMVWNLAAEDIVSAIEASEKAQPQRKFPTLRLHFPEFTTREIHGNYVDSVKWFGDTFLTKSCENNITWWKNANTKSAVKLFQFEFTDCDIWFMRMELDMLQRRVAVGTQTGKIVMFNLETDVPLNQKSILSHSKCTSPVRQMSFSRDSSIMVSGCDNGTVWRWDLKD